MKTPWKLFGAVLLLAALVHQPVSAQRWNQVINGVQSSTWGQQEKLVPGDRAANDNFGYAVAISGEYAIVGSPFEGDFSDGPSALEAGAAYIFIRSGNDWVQQQKLVASDRNTGDHFGSAVAIDGNYAIIGSINDDRDADADNLFNSAGSAYIFVRSGTVWTQQQKIVASDRAENDIFGISVSISGNYALVGAHAEDQDAAGGNEMTQAGSAYVFVRDGSTWTQQQKLVASDRDAGDEFGWSVAINGAYAIVGAWRDEHDAAGGNAFNQAGSAYIFARSGSTWTQQQKLVASDREAFDAFGWSVSISGSYAIAGAYQEDPSGVVSGGSAYIYFRTGSSWTQQQKLVASDRGFGDYFGHSVAIDGDYAVVGAPYESHDAAADNYAALSGSAYVFQRVGTSWVEMQKIVALDRDDNDALGTAVAIGGDYVIAGALSDEHDALGSNVLSSAGSAYIFNFAAAAPINTFTGTGLWSNTARWSLGTVPTAGDSARVAAGAVATVSADAEINALSIAAGAVVDLAAGRSLTVFSHFTNEGEVTSQDLDARLIMAGPSNRIIVGGRIDNIRIETPGGAALTDSMFVHQRLVVMNGILNTNAKLVIMPEGEVIPDAASGALINGDVQVRNYIHPDLTGSGSAQLFLGSTVHGQTLQSFAWNNPMTGIPGGGSSASAFLYDANQAPGDPLNGYVVPPSMSTPMPLGQGAWLRISNSTGWFNSSAPSYTRQVGALEADGRFTWNSFNFCASGCIWPAPAFGNTNGFNLVANPFHATLDFSTVSRTDVENAVYTFNGQGRQWSYWKAGETLNGGREFLAPGQGFFVRALSSGALMTAQISGATPAEPTSLVRQAAPRARVRIKLSNATDKDEALLVIRSQATSGFDIDYDAAKMGRRGLNLSSLAGTADVAINNLSLGNAPVTVQLQTVSEPGAHTLTFAALENWPADQPLTLHDKLLNSYLPVSQGASYSFNSLGAAGISRFELIIGQMPTHVLDRHEAKFALYPNPARGQVHVEGQGITAITLTNVQGQVVAAPVSNNTLDISRLSPGLYLVTIATAHKQVTQQLVVSGQ